MEKRANHRLRLYISYLCDGPVPWIPRHSWNLHLHACVGKSLTNVDSLNLMLLGTGDIFGCSMWSILPSCVLTIVCTGSILIAFYVQATAVRLCRSLPPFFSSLVRFLSDTGSFFLLVSPSCQLFHCLTSAHLLDVCASHDL